MEERSRKNDECNNIIVEFFDRGVFLVRKELLTLETTINFKD